MIVNIRHSGFYSFEEVNLNSVNEFKVIAYDFSYIHGFYDPYKDEKWRAHCKKHGFSPTKDIYSNNGKIFDQYLRLCAEGLI